MLTTTEMARRQGAPIVDFDHHTADYAINHAEISRRMRQETPIAWSPAYGGFWCLSRYKDAKFVLENWEMFTSENKIKEGDMTRRGGIIPPIDVDMPLNFSDPPRHTRLRMLEAPYFTPKYLRQWGQAAADYTTRAIDSIIEKGEGDLVKDICARVPVMTTLHLGGADPEEWEFYAYPGAFASDFAEDDGGAGHQAKVFEKLHAIIVDRRRNPRDDMASSLANAVVDGEPLPTDTAVKMLHIVVTGGFDTAIAILADGFNWLEANPDKAEWLRQNPDKLDNAVDEFMRMWPPVVNMGRCATREVEYEGVTFRPGDWVQVSIHAANHDPEMFENPDEVILDRTNAREQLAFSAGIHRCLGAPLGRVELRHVISEVLRRLPDYKIDRSRARIRPSLAPTRAWETMPITFTPGKREG